MLKIVNGIEKSQYYADYLYDAVMVVEEVGKERMSAGDEDVAKALFEMTDSPLIYEASTLSELKSVVRARLKEMSFKPSTELIVAGVLTKVNRGMKDRYFFDTSDFWISSETDPFHGYVKDYGDIFDEYIIK